MLSNSFNLYHSKQTTVIFKVVEIRQNQDFISHSFIPSVALFLYRDLRFLKENCNRTFNKNKEEFKTIAMGVGGWDQLNTKERDFKCWTELVENVAKEFGQCGWSTCVCVCVRVRVCACAHAHADCCSLVRLLPALWDWRQWQGLSTWLHFKGSLLGLQERHSSFADILHLKRVRGRTYNCKYI